jgi:hypothetical protein
MANRVKIKVFRNIEHFRKSNNKFFFYTGKENEGLEAGCTWFGSLFNMMVQDSYQRSLLSQTAQTDWLLLNMEQVSHSVFLNGLGNWKIYVYRCFEMSLFSSSLCRLCILETLADLWPWHRGSLRPALQ